MSDDEFVDIGAESEVETSDQNRILNNRNKDGKFVLGKDVEWVELASFPDFQSYKSSSFCDKLKTEFTSSRKQQFE